METAKVLKLDKNGNHVIATTSGPKPGNFPPGSIRSRAAAKMLLKNYDDAQKREYEAELANLTPLELATIEGVEDIRVKIEIVKMLRATEDRFRIFGLTIQTPEASRLLARTQFALSVQDSKEDLATLGESLLVCGDGFVFALFLRCLFGNYG